MIFLGSTIGNLTPEPRAQFLAALSDTLQPGDTLLLGTDLVKDADRLVRAYDDAAGVTARFNKNVLAVVNRELDADFDLDCLRARGALERRRGTHRNVAAGKRLRSAFTSARLDLTVDFAAGEEMLTEVSCKFRPERGGRRTRGRRPAPYPVVDRSRRGLRPVTVDAVTTSEPTLADDGGRRDRPSRECTSTVPPARGRASR